jgi:L-threonine kinase
VTFLTCQALASPATGATGVSSSFGTFGELAQGALPGRNGDFLITLPVAHWSAATFRYQAGSDEVRVSPAHKSKARHLAQSMLRRSAIGGGGLLDLTSTLPEGKGMASSSADLVATARAVANALGLRLRPSGIENLIRPIEPTDGVMYPGIVSFDHRRVRLRGRLGSLPSLTILGLDEGGSVDTVAFNQLEKPFSVSDRRYYEHVLDSMALAIAGRDLRTVGRLATASAELNQQLCPKRTLTPMREICDDVGALGVVAAHSGTMLGLLLDPDEPSYRSRLADALRACAGLSGSVALYRSLSFE